MFGASAIAEAGYREVRETENITKLPKGRQTTARRAAGTTGFEVDPAVKIEL